MEKEGQLINPKKATISDSIPPKILKITSKVSADALHNFFNDTLKTGRSSRPELFCKKSVLRNFAKFTRKHLCQSLFF